MKKVCKTCKLFVKTATCPNCGGNQFSENWKGRILVFKPEESVIAKKLSIKKEGVYSIKSK